MSNKNTQLFVIMAFVLGIFSIISVVPLVNPSPEILYQSLTDVDINSGYYIVMDLDCSPGKIDFTYIADKEVNALIMDESQYYFFQNSVYSDSLVAKNMDYAGTISCEIDEPQKLYFIIDNDDQRRADVTKFEIEYIGKRLSILQSVFG